ncbi:hypothetical protein P7H15_17200 [Paenibacillus larvae]|nr:hypothetical protein [Paenibacillus larvae]MDT2294206.1 hypothetical protein [Paenibacillus larvae]
MTTVAASLNQFHSISNQTFTSMNKITQVLQQNVTVQQNFNKAVEEGNKKTLSLADTVKKIGFNLENAKKLAKLAIGGAAEEQGMKNAFIARTGNQDAGTAMFDKFRQEAVQTGMDVNDSLSGTLTFFSSTKDSGQISRLSQLARQMSVFDTGGKGIQGAADALKEALNGDASSLAKSFNIPKADLQAFKIEDLAKSGNIEGFITAFDQLLEKQGMGKQAFETMLDSPALKWEGILNNLTAKFAMVGQGALTALAPLLDLFGNALQNGTFEPFFQIFMIGLTLIGQALAWIANNVIWLAGILLENWVPIAFGLLPIILVTLWSMIAPIMMQAGAWLMAQWPILLIGLAIGLLIFILMQCWVTTEQIVGTIMGSFYALFAFIYNSVALLWDTLVSFGEFFANLFVDPVYAIQKLIYDLAMVFGGYMINMLRSVETFAGGFVKLMLSAVNKVLSGINWFAEKLNSIFGTSFSTITLLDADNIHILSDSLQGALNSIPKPASNKHVADFSKYKMGQKRWMELSARATARAPIWCSS